MTIHTSMTAAAQPAPFFEVSGGSATRRRLLLISPLFPPAPDVGALRWQKMARYVAERGWELDVVMHHPDCLSSRDWGRLSELPPGTRLFGVRVPADPLTEAVETAWRWLRAVMRHAPAARRGAAGGDDRPGRTLRPDSIPRRAITWSLTEPRGYIRAYNAWTAYVELTRWAGRAAALARRIADPRVHDAIISSGPPHAAHEAARLVSRRAGLPFVMDMRDVWGLAQRCQEFFASPLLLHLARRYESRAVHRASLVVANTDAARSAMMQAYPEASGRIVTVMNGFDDDPRPPTRQGSQFIVAYAGTIYLDRDPGSLFRAARRVIEELALSPSQFALKFLGVSDSSVSVAEWAEAEGIAAFVQVGASCPRAQALEFLAQATMLVILPQDTDMAIPAKLFEYVRFDAWLLALAERGSATEVVLRDTAADVVSSTDIDAIAATLRRRYEEHAAGVRPRAIAATERLSRRVQAGILLDALEQQLRTGRLDGAKMPQRSEMGDRAQLADRPSGGVGSPQPRTN